VCAKEPTREIASPQNASALDLRPALTIAGGGLANSHALRECLLVIRWDPTAHQRVLPDFLRHMSSQGFERLLSLFTDDVAYEDVARGVVRHGEDEVRAVLEALFVGFPNATFELTSPDSRFASGTGMLSNGRCAPMGAVCRLRPSTWRRAERKLSSLPRARSVVARTILMGRASSNSLDSARWASIDRDYPEWY
jgi:SnoaL-like domain